jgi:hypothetical protein
MCNCGKKRTELRQQPSAFNINLQSKTPPVVQQKNTVLFQYTGKTGLTITGSVTRKTYRFNFSGDVKPIELSDVQSMTSISVLQRM